MSEGEPGHRLMEAPKKVGYAGCFNGIGLLYAILSAVCFSAGALLVAKVPTIQAFEVTFFRMTVQLVFIIPAVLYYKETFLGAPEDRLLLWTRAALGTWSMCLMYYAIHHMPLGDASVLHFSSPVFVGILAFFILKESCWIFETITTLTTFVGIVLIAEPPLIFDKKEHIDGTEENPYTRLIASSCALLASICGAGVHITLRRLKHAHPSTIIFTYSLWGMIQSAVLCYIVNTWTVPTGAKEWGCLFGVGIFAVMAQICFTLALKTENAGAVSVLRSTEIVFAYIWQITFLNEYPNISTVIGSVLVMCCAVAYGVKKWHKIKIEKKEELCEIVPLVSSPILVQKN